jgi:pyrroline-5-carboxylate reductase
MPDAALGRVRLLLVGGGQMGRALLAGLRHADYPVEVLVVDPAPAAATERQVATLDAAGCFRPDVVVVAVKPALAATVAPGLRGLANPETAVVSFMAGIRLARLRELLGAGPTLLRAMPNLALAVGAGVCGLYAPPQAAAGPVARATDLLASCGEVVRLAREDDLDAVTAVSGSGPAYVFRFVEALAAAGEAQGLSPDLSQRLARQTVIGAGAQLASDRRSTAALREQVTSPGGATAEALGVLGAPGALDALLREAVAAAAARARALAHRD